MSIGSGLYYQPIFAYYVRLGKRSGLASEIARMYAQRQVNVLLRDPNSLREFVMRNPFPFLDLTACSPRALFMRDFTRKLLLIASSEKTDRTEGSRRAAIMRTNRGRTLQATWHALPESDRASYERVSAVIHTKRKLTRKLIRGRQLSGYTLFRSEAYAAVPAPSSLSYSDAHLYRARVLSKKWRRLTDSQKMQFCERARKKRLVSVRFIKALLEMAHERLVGENNNRRQLQQSGDKSARLLFGGLPTHVIPCAPGEEMSGKDRSDTGSRTRTGSRRGSRSTVAKSSCHNVSTRSKARKQPSVMSGMSSQQRVWWRAAVHFAEKQEEAKNRARAERSHRSVASRQTRSQVGRTLHIEASNKLGRKKKDAPPRQCAEPRPKSSKIGSANKTKRRPLLFQKKKKRQSHSSR